MQRQSRPITLWTAERQPSKDQAANHYSLMFWVSKIVISLYCSTSLVNGDCYSSLRWLQYLQWLLWHLTSLLDFKGNFCWLYCINPGIKERNLQCCEIFKATILWNQDKQRHLVCHKKFKVVFVAMSSYTTCFDPFLSFLYPLCKCQHIKNK